MTTEKVVPATPDSPSLADRVIAWESTARQSLGPHLTGPGDAILHAQLLALRAIVSPPDPTHDDGSAEG